MQNSEYTHLITGLMKAQSMPWPEHQADHSGALFIEAAQQHGVLAFLSQFREQLEKAGWPTLILQGIAIAGEATKQIQARREKAITGVFREFSKHNIDALIFKGAANACLLYSHPHLRTHADIDILIRQTQFEQVKQSLRTMGYAFDNILPTKYGPSQSTAMHKAPGETPVTFDIHWKINNRLALANTLEFDELDRRAVHIEQYGSDAMGFSYADAVLAACIHEAGSLNSEKGKLMSLYDVYLLLHKLDARQLQALTTMADEKQIGRLYRHYLQRCVATFCRDTVEDTQLAERVNGVVETADFQRGELSAGLLAENRSWLNNQWLDLRSVGGTMGKIEFMMARLKQKL